MTETRTHPDRAIRCAQSIQAQTGEGPVWSPEEQVLYWTDIPGRMVYRLDPSSGEARSWSMPGRLGCFALRNDGTLIGAMEGHFVRVDLAAGRIDTVAVAEPGLFENRMNDGRCDRTGRFFWAGTMHDRSPRGPRGALYRLDAEGRCDRYVSDLVVSNGVAFSPDGRRMYHSDSGQATVWCYDYDPETGQPSNRQVLITLDERDGKPDGAAVDSEGHYWSACFGGSQVLRISPDGQIVDRIPLPVRCPTMVAFGGPDLTSLYVTSASGACSAEELEERPLSGSVLVVDDVGVAGLPESRFAG